MTTTLTVTKSGRIDFERPIKANQISLKSISLYLNVYNVRGDSKYTNGSTEINIPEGWYTSEQLKKLFYDDLVINENTLKFRMGGELSGPITKRMGSDGFMYLTPLCLYLIVGEIDSSHNYFNGKRSNLLCAIPIGDTEVGGIIKHHPVDEFKKLYSNNNLNSLHIRLEDDHGNEYQGKFYAEFSLNE